MATDAEITIAFLFKRSGKQKLKLSELYLPMSMELNWFSPQDANEFVKQAVKHNLLEEKEGLVTPNFDIEKITVPVGFHPTQNTFVIKEKVEKKEGKDLVFTLIQKICKNTDLDEKAVLGKIKSLSQEKNINYEVAALLVGKEYDVVLEDFYEQIEKRIL